MCRLLNGMERNIHSFCSKVGMFKHQPPIFEQLLPTNWYVCTLPFKCCYFCSQCCKLWHSLQWCHCLLLTMLQVLLLLSRYIFAPKANTNLTLFAKLEEQNLTVCKARQSHAHLSTHTHTHTHTLSLSLPLPHSLFSPSPSHPLTSNCTQKAS